MKEVIKTMVREFLNEKQSNETYYRAVTEFSGNNVVFEPKGYYEAFDDDGNAMFLSGDVLAKSTTPEISASKSIGGALLGVWSMLNHHGSLKNNKIYLYSIHEKPDKDLSNVGMDDFEYIKEVRYKNPVRGSYIGYFVFDNEFNENANNFYERFTSDPWDEYTEEQIEMWEDFEKFLLTVNVSNLLK
jgi:hypothetical protein